MCTACAWWCRSNLLAPRRTSPMHCTCGTAPSASWTRYWAEQGVQLFLRVTHPQTARLKGCAISSKKSRYLCKTVRKSTHFACLLPFCLSNRIRLESTKFFKHRSYQSWLTSFIQDTLHNKYVTGQTSSGMSSLIRHLVEFTGYFVRRPKAFFFTWALASFHALCLRHCLQIQPRYTFTRQALELSINKLLITSFS